MQQTRNEINARNDTINAFTGSRKPVGAGGAASSARMN